MPKRIQLKRKAGWRKPAGAVVVSRPTRWGNPFPISDFGTGTEAARLAVACYKKWLYEPQQEELRRLARCELHGHDLACWCRPGAPCHADVLLELVKGV